MARATISGAVIDLSTTPASIHLSNYGADGVLITFWDEGERIILNLWLSADQWEAVRTGEVADLATIREQTVTETAGG